MSETVTAVQPDKAAMEKINLYTRRAYKPEEVYTFSVVLCDNEVDRDGECFTKETLEELAKLFVGKTGILDHEPTSKNQTARVFDAAEGNSRKGNIFKRAVCAAHCTGVCAAKRRDEGVY